MQNCILPAMTMKNPQSSLPPGFRFHPTDEELILHYLRKRVSSIPLPVSIIAEVDIYKFDPWDLPAHATFGEKEWYFFSPRDRKYPNGARPNRSAGSGYWKATGTDKIITATSVASHGENIGVKKALVFYKGRPPKGIKTNWIMHEYRLAESLCSNNNIRPVKFKELPMRLDDWVLCRIYKKSNVLISSAAAMTMASPLIHLDQEEEERFIIQDTKLPSLTNLPCQNQNLHHPLVTQKSCSFSNLLDALDYSMLSSFLSDPTNQINNLSCFDPATSVLDQLDTTPHHDLPIPSSEEPPMTTQNGLKRQRMSTDAEMSHPSKKFLSSTCNFVNNSAAQFDVPGQYNNINMFNHSLWNQQLFLSSNVQFLG